MVFIRPSELDETIDHVLRRCSVQLVGANGSGRSTILARLDADLTSRGIPTMRLKGVAGLSQTPLGALELAGFDRRPLGRSVDHLAETIGLRGVIIVDDSDQLDAMTSVVLAEVHSRLGTPIVESRSLGSPLEARKPLGDARRSIRLEVAPLSFDCIGELLHAKLSGMVSVELIGRIYTRSAGIPGLASAMAEVGVHSGRIVQRDGTWVGDGDLWHPDLRLTVEDHLRGLSRELLETLEKIILAGPMDLREARRLAPMEHLATLEQRGTLAGITTATLPFVVATPPLLSDYFRDRLSPFQAGRLEAEAAEGADGPRLTITTTETIGGRDPAVDSETILWARLTATRQADRLTRTRQRWEAQPDLPRAREYLDALVDSSTDLAEIAEAVLEAERRLALGPQDEGLIRYRVRALFATESDPDRIRELVSEITSEPGARTDGAAAWRLFYEAFHLAIPADFEQRLAEVRARLGADHPAVVHARVFSWIAGGDFDEALEFIERRQADGGALGDDLLAWKGWALLGRGECVAAYELATARVEQARHEIDAATYRTFAHLECVCLLYLGRYRLAETRLGVVLALGEPGRGLGAVYAACLNLAAVLASRAGRPAFELSLTRQPTMARRRVGPLPGMLGDISEVAALSAAGEEHARRDWHARLLKALLDRGFRFHAATAATEPAMFGMSIRRQTGLRNEVELAGTLVAPIYRLDAALETSDLEELTELARWFAERDRLFHARQAAEAAVRIAEDHQDVRLAELRELNDSIASRQDPADAAPFVRRRSARDLLSSREFSAARLAAFGRGNREIAEQLDVNVRTVESHLSNAYRKLGVSSRAELHAFDWS